MPKILCFVGNGLCRAEALAVLNMIPDLFDGLQTFKGGNERVDEKVSSDVVRQMTKIDFLQKKEIFYRYSVPTVGWIKESV